MEFIFFLFGIIVGVIFMVFRKRNETIHGIVHVDHKNERCAFSITSNQLIDTSKKTAVFYINHDAELSREEHLL
jgi:hypothetical protein